MEIDCRRCEKEFEIPEESSWGGDATCPYCGTIHDMCFETAMGLYVDGIIEPENLGK